MKPTTPTPSELGAAHGWALLPATERNLTIAKLIGAKLLSQFYLYIDGKEYSPMPHQAHEREKAEGLAAYAKGEGWAEFSAQRGLKDERPCSGTERGRENITEGIKLMNGTELNDATAPRSVDQQQACSAFLRTINDDLYTEPVFTALDDCYEQGQAASSQGFSRDQNPYPKGTAQREWWDGGHCNETDELTGEA